MVATEPRTQAPRPAPEAPEYPDAVRMAFAAVGAVGLGLAACQFPYGRIAALAVCGAGCALAGLSVPGLTRRAWLGWAGFGANAVLVFALLVSPGTLGVAGWLPPRASERDTAGGEWIDAGEFAWEENGVRVALTFATVTSEVSGEKCLWVGATATNVGAHPAEFAGWGFGSAHEPALTTADGGPVRMTRGGGAKAGTVAPGETAECVLVFEAPPAGQELHLALPGGAYGGTVPARFRIAPGLVLSRP